MFGIIKNRSTHSARLERWIGPQAEFISRSTRGWYGPKIAMGGCPGEVYVGGDGDFSGPLVDAGFEACALQKFRDLTRRIERASRVCSKGWTLNTGFSTLGDFVREARFKRQRLMHGHPAQANAMGASTWNSMLRKSSGGAGGIPGTGSTPPSAPGGRACDSTTQGAIGPQNNPASGDRLYFAGGSAFYQTNVANGTNSQCFLLYDRLFDVAKTMSSTASETVTGVPTRYQSTTASDPDYIGGNFAFIEPDAGLGLGAHNWDVNIYIDQDGNSSTLPSVTGTTGQPSGVLDHAAWQWFVPLAAGDVGIKAWTNLKCSASIGSGPVNFCIGHPLAFLPVLQTFLVTEHQGITSAFNFVRIFDNAMLALLYGQAAGGSINVNGSYVTIDLVAG